MAATGKIVATLITFSILIFSGAGSHSPHHHLPTRHPQPAPDFLAGAGEEAAAASAPSPAPEMAPEILPRPDIDLLELPLNLEFFEAEFFLWGSLGRGLDAVQHELSGGGPPPAGAKKAVLNPLVRDIIAQFGYQEVGHVRAIKKAIGGGFPRPPMNLSSDIFAEVMNSAMQRTLDPPFDPYASTVNYLLASYILPYVGLTGYVGAAPELRHPRSRRLVAGLLAVEAAQDAVIRSLLYQRADEAVEPYGDITVAEATDGVSRLRDELAGEGIKDEGIVFRRGLGAERKVEGNVIAGDEDSLAYSRSPEDVLRIVYGTGDEGRPGGFFPDGAAGRIAGELRRRRGGRH